ncbi:MAG: hypothetical protein AB7U81_12520 [Thiohalomonadaceae bacterium]
MKQIALAAAVLSLAAAGCSGGSGSSGSSDSANKPVEKVIGAAGGTITTSDGRMKLDIPAGALDADVTISITPQPDGSYRLEPAGLQFSVPATATFTLPADGPVQVETDDGPLVIPNAVAPQLFTLTGADGKEEGLSSAVSHTAGANHVTVSVPVPHFSVIRQVAGSVRFWGTATGVELEKDKYDVGEQFTARMSFFSDPERAKVIFRERMWLRAVEYAGEDAVAYAGPGPSEEEYDQLLEELTVLVREPAFRCEKDGQGAVKVRVTMQVVGIGSERTTDMEVRVPVTCGSDGDHDGGETGNVLVNGNHALPEGMTGPDGFTLLMWPVLDELGGWKALQFMGTEGGVVTLGYNSPPQVIDLSEAGFLSGWSGQTYGVLAFTTPDDGVEFFAYGLSGSAAQGYTATNGFGMTVLWGAARAALDASTIGGGLRHAHGYVVPDSMGFTSYEWSEEDGFLVMNNIHAPQVNAVSAYQHRVGGPILAVSGGEGGSGSGKLKVVDRSGDMPAATDIGDVGDTPRRLRCLVPVCVVSNHGSNSLSVITWDGESLTPSIVGTVAVGKGPVGVDLVRVSDNDNVAVVSTGFNDDTYSVTVLKPDGNVVSNENYDAPAGCESPAHAMFAEDAGKLKIVMTCHGSGSIAITDAPF